MKEADRNGLKAMSSMFKGFKLEGRLNTDKELVKTLKEAVERVSPTFNESPLMVGLELFEDLGVDLEYFFSDIL